MIHKQIQLKKYQKEFNISRLVANIIANKGLKDKKEIEIFFKSHQKGFL